MHLYYLHPIWITFHHISTRILFPPAFLSLALSLSLSLSPPESSWIALEDLYLYADPTRESEPFHLPNFGIYPSHTSPCFSVEYYPKGSTPGKGEEKRAQSSFGFDSATTSRLRSNPHPFFSFPRIQMIPIVVSLISFSHYFSISFSVR
ncbi:hypothetical protein IE53DRAFT_71033 [Violaceomyces palustris]|uniref:Uncharacterized protein n=1 Tax=Violaceomyces palustris TaxID=1673888 RepID=A0ACD0P8Y6_9BASI|nr:hypothetical protein IE53DRAFT_71033 [Violaceomyces palustris]